jgi:hypothetical protein
VLFHVFNYPVSYIRVELLKRSAPLCVKNRVQRFSKVSMQLSVDVAGCTLTSSGARESPALRFSFREMIFTT